MIYHEQCASTLQGGGCSGCQLAAPMTPPTHRAIPKGVEHIVQSVLKRGMVSTLLMPKCTLTVMMFDFCTLVLATGKEDKASSG